MGASSVMNDYILLMHNDALMHSDAPERSGKGDAEWAAYFAKLEQVGAFQGGSAIGDGVCISKSPAAAGITQHLAGYIRIQAESFSHARELVVGNPVFEAGGTVEIRELPKS
jgi:hypothetical protein